MNSGRNPKRIHMSYMKLMNKAEMNQPCAENLFNKNIKNEEIAVEISEGVPENIQEVLLKNIPR